MTGAGTVQASTEGGQSGGRLSGHGSQLIYLGIVGAILLSCLGCCVILLLADDGQSPGSTFSAVTLLFCMTIIVLPVFVLIYLLFFTPESLRSQQVIDHWSTLVEGGKGYRQNVVADLHTRLAELDPPRTLVQERRLASGRILGGSGERRPFVVVSYEGNVRIAPYRMYVSVRDYGNALQTSWYLVVKPTVWQWLLQRAGLLGLDFFEEEDLRGHVTAVHHAFIDAVIALLTTLGKDTAINRTSKGFLGVS